MKYSINDFFRKCYQIRRKLRMWSYLPKKSLMENFIFCAVNFLQNKNAIVLSFTVLILQTEVTSKNSPWLCNSQSY